MPRFGFEEGGDADVGEGGAHAGVISSGPRQPWADSVTAIPIHTSCIHFCEDGFGSLHVLGEYACGEAVLSITHLLDRFGVILDSLNADHRTKRLVFHEQHIVVDITEDRRREEVSFSFEWGSTKEASGPFGLGVVYLLL